MSITVQIVCDSIGLSGKRLTTFQVRVPKFLLQEIARHRVLSLSFNSSRAIPTKKLREQVWVDPFSPIEWGSNKSGMSAGDELSGWRLLLAKTAWNLASKNACFWHWVLSAIGLHKQHANRSIEGFVWADGIISGTEWDNFFNLRCHKDAQPEFRLLASKMQFLLASSNPDVLEPGEWHLPFIYPNETKHPLEILKKLSASRCARVSYGLPDFNHERDIKRADMLLSAHPPHLSPFEHVAQSAFSSDYRSGNYLGWHQYRHDNYTK